MTEPSALGDLHAWVSDGLERGGELLSAGEVLVARRILALGEEEGLLFARLQSRRPIVFSRDDLCSRYGEDAWELAARLVALELADHLITPEQRLEQSTAGELRLACKRLGLPSSGSRAVLVERLRDHPRWDERPWLRLRHRTLVQRLGRLATLRRHPDPAQAVVQRLGHVQWPTYPLTPGPAAHPHRHALLAWEHALARLDEADGDELLALLRTDVGSPASSLDLRRAIAKRVIARSYARERQGEPALARTWLEALPPSYTARTAVRRARCLEAEGRPRHALEVLLAARETADHARQLELQRAGRRLARTLRSSWPPFPPLPPLRERHLQLSPGLPRQGRPTWRVGGVDAPVEQAVLRQLALAGRRALHVEGGLWRALYGLLIADLRFLPVRGALPVPRLDAPLDEGTPHFRAARRDEVAATLQAIRRGGAPELVRQADAQWRGVRLRGVDWSFPSELLAEVALATPSCALAAMVEHLVDGGRGASAGLPDLIVLPGDASALSTAHRLHEGLFLAEIKGPGDTLRDEQRAWIGRLTRAGLAVEVWHVHADGSPPTKP